MSSTPLRFVLIPGRTESEKSGDGDVQDSENQRLVLDCWYTVGGTFRIDVCHIPAFGWWIRRIGATGLLCLSNAQCMLVRSQSDWVFFICRWCYLKYLKSDLTKSCAFWAPIVGFSSLSLECDPNDPKICQLRSLGSCMMQWRWVALIWNSAGMWQLLTRTWWEWEWSSHILYTPFCIVNKQGYEKSMNIINL